jgi:hypothetical protein
VRELLVVPLDDGRDREGERPVGQTSVAVDDVDVPVRRVALRHVGGGAAGRVAEHVQEARALEPETRRDRRAPAEEVTPGLAL